MPKGIIPWNKGKKELRQYVLKKMSISHVGKKQSKETIEKKRIAHTGKKRSAEFIKNLTGKNHPRWIEDRNTLKKSDKKHLDVKYVYWMREVKNRDGWKCKILNKDCSGRLEAHHILPWRDYVELRYDINNGISLCQFHHPRKRADEIKLSPYFQSIVANIK